MYTIHYYSDINILEKDWRRLEVGSSMSYFQTYDWYRSILPCVHKNCRKYESKFAVLYQDSILKIIAPIFVIKRTFKLINKKGIYLLGYGGWSDYLNFIYKDAQEEDFIYILNDIKNHYRCHKFYFDDLPEKSLLYSVIRNNYCVEVDDKTTCVELKIPNTLDAYKNMLSKNTRQNIRTAANRLSKSGLRVTYNFDDKEVSKESCELLRENRLKKKRNKSSWKHDIKYKILSYLSLSFHYAIPFYADTQSHIMTSTINNELAAFFNYGIDKVHKRVVLMAVGTSEPYGWYSPGFQLIYEFIRKEIGLRDIQVIDFTRGNESYKYSLGGNEHYSHRVVFSIKEQPKPMMKVIVIGGNHVNTLGLIRSIGEKGLPVYLLLEHQENLDTCYLRFSKYITKIYHLKDETEILTILKCDFGNDEIKPVILCASDASICLLDEHYDELKDSFLFFNAGKKGRINYFMNKNNMFSLAEKCGLRIIKTWQLKEGDIIPDDINYPCFSKPQNSALYGKKGTGINYTEDELKEKLNLCPDLLVQEFIDKEYEIDINGFSYNHGENVLINSVCRKIRDYTDRQTQYVVLEDISLYPMVDLTAIKKLVNTIGYEGIFSVELMYKDGIYYFLEINLRNDAANYLYTKGGYNYPYLWYLYCKYGRLDYIQISLPKKSRPLYLIQWSDFSDVIHRRISLFQWLRDLSRTRAFFVLNWRDPKPFMFVIWQNVKLIFHKLHILK